MNLSEVSVGRLMKRLEFAPQRPLYRAWQQHPTLVDYWREHEYPAIAARAKREGALIFFADDESGIRPDHHAGTTWAPAGKTPVIKATGARYGFNMLSAVSAQGQFRFMTIEGRVNAEVFRELLKRLITGVQRKVFLVIDGHPAHPNWCEPSSRTTLTDWSCSSCRHTRPSSIPTNWCGPTRQDPCGQSHDPDQGRTHKHGRQDPAALAEAARHYGRLLFRAPTFQYAAM